MPEETKPVSAREPRPLSSEYHKARKQLMLWAGILFIWELIGIDLEKIKEAGGNAGAIIGAIKSPQAVPWALLILVVYFAFKLRIEWGQCNRVRRQGRESRMDYYSAFVVASAACALYFGQAASHVQLANAIQQSSKIESIVSGATAGVAVTIFIFLLWEWRGKKKKKGDVVGALYYLTAASYLAISFVWRRKQPIIWPLAFISAFIGSIVALGIHLVKLYLRKQVATSSI